jgi:hypothetical protein
LTYKTTSPILLCIKRKYLSNFGLLLSDVYKTSASLDAHGNLLHYDFLDFVFTPNNLLYSVTYNKGSAWSLLEIYFHNQNENRFRTRIDKEVISGGRTFIASVQDTRTDSRK